MAVVANVSFVLYDPRWFKICSKIIMNITALVAALTLLTVFPFVINTFILALGLKFILIVGVVASFVSIIFQILRLAYLIASY